MANQLILDRALDANGYVAAGAKATVYAAGTSTEITVYSDVAGTIAATNPIVADGNGAWPQRYVTEEAKVVVTDADDASIPPYTLDPVPTSLGDGSQASEVGFSPTVELPFTNVQAAVEGAVAVASSGYAAFGIGITGNAVLLAALDATNIAAGLFRFDGTTTGTYPTGVAAADTGLVETWRQSATVGMMELHHATTNRRFRRRLTGGTWGAWRENIEVNIGATRGDLIRRGASDWERVALGTSGQVLTSDGTDAAWGTGFAPTEVASAALTGASVNLFTGLPSGVKRINVWARNVSLDAGANYAGIQIGTGGSFVTSGYDSASGNRGGEFTSTARFLDVGSNASAATVYDVAYELRKFAGGNVWLCKHQGTIQGSTPFHGFGNLTLAGEIDRIRYNANSAAFDGGFIFAEWFGY